MEFKVLSVLKKYMSDEEFTAFTKADDFEKSLQADITKYITANTPKQDELVKEAQKTAHAEVITELGIKDIKTVAELQAHMKVVNDTTTDKDAELIKLTKLSEKLQTDYDAEVILRTTLQSDKTLSSQMAKVTGLVGEEQAEFIHFKLGKQVTEEKPFDIIFAEYEEANPAPEERKFVDPRFQRKQATNKAEDGYEIYKRLKKEGKI